MGARARWNDTYTYTRRSAQMFLRHRRRPLAIVRRAIPRPAWRASGMAVLSAKGGSPDRGIGKGRLRSAARSRRLLDLAPKTWSQRDPRLSQAGLDGGSLQIYQVARAPGTRHGAPARADVGIRGQPDVERRASDPVKPLSFPNRDSPRYAQGVPLSLRDPLPRMATGGALRPGRDNRRIAATRAASTSCSTTESCTSRTEPRLPLRGRQHERLFEWLARGGCASTRRLAINWRHYSRNSAGIKIHPQGRATGTLESSRPLRRARASPLQRPAAHAAPEFRIRWLLVQRDGAGCATLADCDAARRVATASTGLLRKCSGCAVVGNQP